MSVSSHTTMDDVCVICYKELGADSKDVATLTEKGSNGINIASEKRNDTIKTVSGQRVHVECRRSYCHPRNVDRTRRQQDNPPSTRRNSQKRSSDNVFRYKTNCLYCGTEVVFNESNKRPMDTHHVTTVETKDTLLDICAGRHDAWAEVVKARILHVHDLHAADAVYHQSCSVNFRTGKQIPQNYVIGGSATKRNKTGRPKSTEQHDAFIAVVNYLQENDEEQITISDLCTKMDKYLENSDTSTYSHPHMKNMIKGHFGDRIVITEINGRSNVVTFKTTVDGILQEFHAHSINKDQEDEKMNIIRTAAKLIKQDIKSIKTTGVSYPEVDENVEEHIKFIPLSLLVFLENIVAGKHRFKVASMGHAVMQAARPRALIAPLQIGLAIQLHHGFASRFLIDSLNSHGFCSSYSEVQQFSKNAAVHHSTDIPSFNGEFVQYAADNVDHNVRTLDGKDTFHGMGIISTVTPGTEHIHCIPRRQVEAEEISSAGYIQIVQPVEPRCTVEIRYNEVPIKEVTDPSKNLELLWEMSLLFETDTRSSWSGTMQSSLQGEHPGKSSVIFLPMIDMNPSDNTCIYSTLKFVAEHALKHNIKIPIVTFDQPLWWKAYNLIETEPIGSAVRNVLVRLGGLHTESSFLGAIGHLMGESGLKELLELVYASNAVDHMLSGKAIARAVRGHLLVDAALCTLLYATALQIPLPVDASVDAGNTGTDECEIPARNNQEAMGGSTLSDDNTFQKGASLLEEASGLFNQLTNKDTSWEEIDNENVWESIRQTVAATQASILERSRTSALWFQYMEMVRILRVFIKAERTGNWELHLNALSQMLPYLAASGHNLYVKCTRLYLQSMRKLESDQPDVYRSFMSGFHVVRRSERYWGGLSTDLIIEQCLMRSLKTSGGLTRGRGLTDQQRVTWLLAMPTCAEVNRVMQELSGVNFTSGEQNKDMSKTRRQRDMKDTLTIISALQERSPFSPDPQLRNIMNGVHADSSVNVDEALKIGNKVLTSMTGKSVAEYTFRRSGHAITLASKSAIKINDERVEIDPQLLFQRLILAANVSEDLPSLFRYELSSFPASLFDSSHMLRQANKPALADAIWSKMSPEVTAETTPCSDVHYVLDGGALLHRVIWPSVGSATFGYLCGLYCEYVTKKYSKPTVVFDGYKNTSSTKQMTQQRRSLGKVGPTVSFTRDMKVMQKKDIFLANVQNKERFVAMISESLRHRQCVTYHSDGDADLLIVKTAVESAKTKNTVLVGDDTDLLVLLLFHATVNSKDLYFIPEPKSNSLRRRVWNIKKVKAELGVEVCNNVLYLHAVLGCDTTSRVHGIGKGASLKKFINSPGYRQQAEVFNGTATKEDVIVAGENALVMLYNGNPGQSLDALRFQRFQEKLVTNTAKVNPNTLPPTSAAAKFHSLRVYAQVLQWRGEVINIEDWGWRMRDGSVIPIMSDLPPAPDSLLRIVRCNCETGCSTMRCSCRKHNLECSPACGHCRGSSCTNSPVSLQESDESDED